MSKKPNLPDWLQQTNPPATKSRRTSRFIIQNLHLINHLLTSLAQEPTTFRRVKTPWVQLVSLLVTVLVILLTQSLVLIWVIWLLTLLRICLLPATELMPLFKRIFKISLIAICLILPNLLLGELSTTLLFIARLEILLINIALFLQEIYWQDFILALRQLHFPNLLVLTLDISLKYSHILASFIQESLWAISMRSVGKKVRQQNLIGSIVGRLYLNTRAYINELYNAMLLRGYGGQPKQKNRLTMNWRDSQMVIWDVGLICLFFIIRG